MTPEELLKKNKNNGIPTPADITLPENGDIKTDIEPAVVEADANKDNVPKASLQVEVPKEEVDLNIEQTDKELTDRTRVEGVKAENKIGNQIDSDRMREVYNSDTSVGATLRATMDLVENEDGTVSYVKKGSVSPEVTAPTPISTPENEELKEVNNQIDSQMSDYDSMMKELQSNIEQETQTAEEEQKRSYNNALFGGLTDVAASIANLIATTKGATSAQWQSSVPQWQNRYDTLRRERETKLQNYKSQLNALQNQRRQLLQQKATINLNQQKLNQQINNQDLAQQRIDLQKGNQAIAQQRVDLQSQQMDYKAQQLALKAQELAEKSSNNRQKLDETRRRNNLNQVTRIMQQIIRERAEFGDVIDDEATLQQIANSIYGSLIASSKMDSLFGTYDSNK